MESSDSTLRQRKPTKQPEDDDSSSFEFVKTFDAFPKMEESYQETSVVSGGFSIVIYLLVVFLSCLEIRHWYLYQEFKYIYQVDKSLNRRMPLYIDITVASKCNNIGADLLDAAQRNAQYSGQLEATPVHFELLAEEQAIFDVNRQINNYFSTQYHAIHESVIKNALQANTLQIGGTTIRDYKTRALKFETPPNACRFNGTLVVNKLAGNFHILMGKPVTFIGMGGGGHVHLNFNGDTISANFSHRIDELRFGHRQPFLLNALDHDLKVASHTSMLYQYFLEVIPFSLDGVRYQSDNAYQYSVTEQDRLLDHAGGSHGQPGIIIKYDMSAIEVIVEERTMAFSALLLRLCSIVGGVVATSGLLNSVFACVSHFICCRWYASVGGSSSHQPTSSADFLGTDLSPRNPKSVSQLGFGDLLVPPATSTARTSLNGNSHQSSLSHSQIQNENLPIIVANGSN